MIMLCTSQRIRNVFAGVRRPVTFLLATTIVVVLAKQWNRWEGAAPRHDAYLQSDLTPISATLPGYVGSVPVQDYQRVHAGCSDSRDPTPGERPCLIPCPPRTA